MNSDSVFLKPVKMDVKVLISEDHELYRDGLRTLLLDTFPNIQITESAHFATTQTILAKHSDFALVLFDINMPGTSGLDGLSVIKTLYPALPLVVISTVDFSATIDQMLALGADGFITKTSSKTVMVNALRAVMDGERVVISDHQQVDAFSLSPRQSEILSLVAQGLSNKSIALKLNIAPSTAREYVSDLLELFNCGNRTQMALKARQLGFLLD
ncbi:response regulator [Reinekea sp.]|jgi:DNA-binding NarL/FixJ family response regulator|uniref:response regulator n=1 Tax=Reinekea sp. TaxID=1970455 RepID=UPI0039895656